MKNAVGREIPDYLLTNGREVYHGKNYKDGKTVTKASPTTVWHEKPQEDKLCGSIREACERCGAHDGMTFSFYTEFRDGDYVAAMVCKVLVEELGLKDLHVAATSLGSAQDIFADYMEQGILVEAQTSGVRGRIGETISHGRLKNPAIIRSHGGRPRAVEAGEVHIDIAFMAASTSDCCGNAKGTGGKNNCGSMGFANHDAHFADHTVIVTDTLVPFPNLPSSISCIDVDAVCVVDAIGDPKKIATKEARMTDNPRELMMAHNVANVIAATPYFKDGFSFQTGVGGPSLAVNRFLEEHMREKGIRMSFALGGTSSAICALQDKGLVDYILDTQDFDQDAAPRRGIGRPFGGAPVPPGENRRAARAGKSGRLWAAAGAKMARLPAPSGKMCPKNREKRRPAGGLCRIYTEPIGNCLTSAGRHDTISLLLRQPGAHEALPRGRNFFAAKVC